jgi:putative endonuclease
MKNYWIYILTNPLNTRLYIGVTNDLRYRLGQHQAGTGSKFTKKYHLNKLVYYEHFEDIEAAIRREKQLKRWRREKKGKLIESKNPQWDDLTMVWGPS